jgi:hypothetical protein
MCASLLSLSFFVYLQINFLKIETLKVKNHKKSQNISDDEMDQDYCENFQPNIPDQDEDFDLVDVFNKFEIESKLTPANLVNLKNLEPSLKNLLNSLVNRTVEHSKTQSILTYNQNVRRDLQSIDEALVRQIRENPVASHRFANFFADKAQSKCAKAYIFHKFLRPVKGRK